MIERYTRKEMGKIWSDEHKFSALLEVEVAVAKAQAELKIIPRAAALAIAKKSKFNLKRILELEKVTKHDVIAFVSNVAENVGDHGRYVHFGMTSSDVLDTATSLLIREAGDVLIASVDKLEKALEKKARSHAGTLCAGRTHGMHAEPTSFGLKLAGHLMEVQRHRARLVCALKQAQVAKLSGAVGTYSSQPPEVEARVARFLKLQTEMVATQVIPRDRHAEVILALAQLGAGLERLAIEIRHLQRTEVSEVFEGFSQGQKGSSAMPHKRNPIGSENITGCARLLRSYAFAALENVALWHERDISHSSVERVIFPDAFILCDYAVDRMAQIIAQIEVKVDRMKLNMNLSQGQLFSSHVLLELVKTGLSREEAYSIVQSCSHKLRPGQNLADALKKDKAVTSRLKTKEINAIFSGASHKKSIRAAVEKALRRRSK